MHEENVTAIHRLRKEYEKGIVSNEELKRQLELEITAVSTRERCLQADVLTMSNLRQKLDESLRCNDSLQEELAENLKSGSGVERVKKELSFANKKNQALALQIENLRQSIQQFNDIGKETAKLRHDVQQAQNLNQTLREQLKDTRESAAEIPPLQRELRQAKMMNEQLGKQLADVLNHMSKLKTQNQGLQSEVDQQTEQIDSLELRLSSKPEMHSRGVSPSVSMATVGTPPATPPRKDHVYTQTSPACGLASPPPVTRLSSPPVPPREVSPTSVIEKMHRLNKTLMAENQFLRNKLKQNERYTATLKDELELYNRMKRDSIQGPPREPASSGQHMDEVLSMYMTEMRELRMRLEESIRTNDKLRAQLEKRMNEGGAVEGAGGMIPYVQENETLRAKLLAKDKDNDEMKRKLEDMTRKRDM